MTYLQKQVPVGGRSTTPEGGGEFSHGFTGSGKPAELLLSVGGQFVWLGGREPEPGGAINAVETDLFSGP